MSVRAGRLAWIGVALQPVGIVLVLIAHGLLVEPSPPRPEGPMLLQLGLLAVAGLVPVAVQGVRTGGGIAELAGRLLGWGFAQSGAGIATALLVGLVAGHEWSTEALFSGVAGVLAAAVVLVCCVLWIGALMLVAALRIRREDGSRHPVGALVLGGAGVSLVSALVLGVAAVGLGSGPGRGAVSVLTWAFLVEGAPGWVIVARVGGVGVVLGLLAAVAGTVLAVRRRSPERASPGADG